MRNCLGDRSKRSNFMVAFFFSARGLLARRKMTHLGRLTLDCRAKASPRVVLQNESFQQRLSSCLCLSLSLSLSLKLSVSLSVSLSLPILSPFNLSLPLSFRVSASFSPSSFNFFESSLFSLSLSLSLHSISDFTSPYVSLSPFLRFLHSIFLFFSLPLFLSASLCLFFSVFLSFSPAVTVILSFPPSQKNHFFTILPPP